MANLSASGNPGLLPGLRSENLCTPEQICSHRDYIPDMILATFVNSPSFGYTLTLPILRLAQLSYGV